MLIRESRWDSALSSQWGHFAMAGAAGSIVGLLALKLSPTYSLLVALAVLSALVIRWRPVLGLIAIVVVTSGLIDDDSLPMLKLGPISFHLTDIALGWLLLQAIARPLVSRRVKWVATPLDLPLICLVAATCASALLSTAYYGVDPNFVFRILRVLCYYLVFFAATNLIVDKKQLSFLVNSLLIIAVAGSVAVLIQTLVPSLHILRSSSSELVTADRMYSGITRTFAATDRLVYVMLLISVCSVAIRQHWLPTWLAYATTALLGVGILLTFQRNYWLTLVAMFALLQVVLSGHERSRTLLFAACTALAFAVAALASPLPIEEYISAAWNRLAFGMNPATLTRDSSTMWRVAETQYAIQSILQNPLLGVGLGNLYRPVLPDDYWYALSGPALPGAGITGLRWYAHNAYLWIWVDLGLPGIASFVWLYALAIWRGLANWRRISDTRYKAVLLGSTLGLLGQAISNVVAPNFVQSWALVVYPIFMAINELVIRWDALEQSQLRLRESEELPHA